MGKESDPWRLGYSSDECRPGGSEYKKYIQRIRSIVWSSEMMDVEYNLRSSFQGVQENKNDDSLRILSVSTHRVDYESIPKSVNNQPVEIFPNQVRAGLLTADDFRVRILALLPSGKRIIFD